MFSMYREKTLDHYPRRTLSEGFIAQHPIPAGMETGGTDSAVAIHTNPSWLSVMVECMSLRATV